MRFFASIFVILGHSYAISGSPLKYDFIYRGTGEIISLGGVCVSLFFICSGYLITRSIGRVDKFFPYIKARLKRLVPPLAFVIVLTVIAGVFSFKNGGKEISSLPPFLFSDSCVRNRGRRRYDPRRDGRGGRILRWD